MPPLRERGDDVILLAQDFLQRFGKQNGRDNLAFDSQALKAIASHPWPGNVRELEHALQRAALLSPDALLSPTDFPDLLSGQQTERNETSLEGLIAAKLQSSLAQLDIQEMDNLYEMVLHQMERPLIDIVLDKTRGNQVKAAEILGINRNTLRKKMQFHGIK